LRLLSIDTPETYKPRCDAELTKGREATARLRELVANAQRIEVVDSGQADKYDRRLVHLLIDGRDVGQTLMAEGLAVEWRPGRMRGGTPSPLVRILIAFQLEPGAPRRSDRHLCRSEEAQEPQAPDRTT
jgi:endonuclease YncB( thermonuclease family)